MGRFHELLEARRLLSENALQFDGSNDVAQFGGVGATPLDLGNNATIEMKVNFKALPGTNSRMALIGKGTPGSTGWLLSYANETVGGTTFKGLDFEIDSNAGHTTTGTGWLPQINKWYHLALVKTNQGYKIYIDGVEQGDGSSSIDPPATNETLQIGRVAGQFPFNGMLDELRLWNTPRTVTQINDNRNKALTGSEEGLVGYWDFNDSVTSQTLLDKTKNQNDGWRGSSSTGSDTSDPAFVILSGGGATISGTVFSDTDRDGVLDSGEPRLSGKKMFIDADKDGNLDAGERTATTNSSGVYSFGLLTPGTYRIRRADLPVGYKFSVPAAGYHDVTVSGDQKVEGKNFGAIPIEQPVGGSISGVVYSDTDKDGVLDSGETRLGAKKMFIDADKDGVLDAGEKTATTNASGEYVFTGLAAGSYRIRRADLPQGYTYSAPASGFYDVTLSTGQKVTGRNFGAIPVPVVTLGKISGSVFSDNDGDGVRDTGEGGLSFRRIFIDKDNDGVYDPEERFAISDANGNWTFNELAAGTYIVRMVKQPGWSITTPSNGVISITLAAGQSRTEVRFGEHHL